MHLFAFKMNNIDLIAFDLDGTLLNNKNVIPSKTLEMIRILQNEGYTFSIITGRHFTMSNLYLQQTKIKTYVSCNGAYIFNKNKKIRHPINHETTEQIIDYCKNNNLEYGLFTEKEILFSPLHPRRKALSMYNNMARNENVPFLECRSTNCYKGENVYKFLIYTKYIEKTTNELKKNKNTYVTSSSNTLVEVTTNGIDKGFGLLEINKLLNTSVKRNVVFGDSMNDISMFKIAGYRIAMENSPSELKELADCVISRSDEIANILKRIREGI